MKNLIWFRNDLRVHDNESLNDALKGELVIAIYCFDPIYFELDEFGFKRTEKFRAKFLIETLYQLEINLKKLNIPFFVFHGDTAKHISELIKTYSIDQVFLQKEWTRDETKILAAVKSKVSKQVIFNEKYNQFLYHPEDIPFRSVLDLPDVFTHFRKSIEKSTSLRPLVEVDTILSKTNLLENQTHIPSLNDLGFTDFEIDSRTAFPFKGGENEAIQRINDYFWNTKRLSYYKKTRNGLIGTNYSSKLSPWLANGSISPRTIYWEIKKFEQQVVKNQDTYWLIFELIWRDYFKYISLKYGHKIFEIGGIHDRKYDWHMDNKHLRSWTSGNTEEPFVNANMKELACTGWMSNRGRQNVASYWSKHLQQDWRIGAAYFESLLLDYDVHSNWCNWMYNSGVGNDPRDRKFNVSLQASRYDAQSKYQNLWL